jgi:hypothetical protein
MVMATSTDMAHRGPASPLTSGAARAAEHTLEQLQGTDNPGLLVRSLEPYDLLMAWHLADDEQRADLLKMADKAQVDLLVDIRCWKSDLPDIDAVEELISPLVMTGFAGATRALQNMEGELRTLLLKRNARVHLLEDINEEIVVPDTSELIPCPDGRYFIELPDPDQVTDVERALFQTLLMQPFDFYQRELECIRHELPGELTELAYRWRKGRLADYGFATREEAMEMLVPYTVDEVRQMAASSEPAVVPPSDFSWPVLYREVFTGNEFLDAVMEVLNASDTPELLARRGTLGAELAAMINLFLSAGTVNLGDVEEVARMATWARDLMALGLSECADGDESEGARLLSVISPGIFLRVALGLLYPLRKRARRVLGDRKLIPSGRKGSIFDPPYFVALSCLSRDIPAFCPSLSKEAEFAHSLFEPKKSDLKAFSTPRQVQYAERLLEEAELLPSLLFDGLECERPPVRGTPASILVLNALANAAADREPTAKPIEREEANVFAEELLALNEDQLLSDALAVLAPLMDASLELPRDLHEDSDPARRLLIRLIKIGRSRLAADAPERILLIESI